MRAMITAYREDNEDVEFKFHHVFARIENCDKWSETRSLLDKAKVVDPSAPASTASAERPTGTKKAKALRDTEKFHTAITACITDAAAHAAKRTEQAIRMEELAAVRWASVIERQDLKLELLKANVATKKRREDLAILTVDTSGMDDEVKAWYAEQRGIILAERRAPAVAPIATQASAAGAPEAAAPEEAGTPEVEDEDAQEEEAAVPEDEGASPATPMEEEDDADIVHLDA